MCSLAPLNWRTRELFEARRPPTISKILGWPTKHESTQHKARNLPMPRRSGNNIY